MLHLKQNKNKTWKDGEEEADLEGTLGPKERQSPEFLVFFLLYNAYPRTGAGEASNPEVPTNVDNPQQKPAASGQRTRTRAASQDKTF